MPTQLNPMLLYSILNACSQTSLRWNQIDCGDGVFLECGGLFPR